MPFDLEYGCRYLIRFIVSRKRAEELEESDFKNISEQELLTYINQLMDLGWVKEQKLKEKDEFVIYAFTEKGRRMYENPNALMSLTDSEREHIMFLRKLDAARREEDLINIPPLLLSLAQCCLGVGRYDSALVYAVELQNLAERIKSLYFKAESLIMQSKIDNARGELDASIKSLSEGIRLFRELGEKNREAEALRLAGGILVKMGDFDNAMKHFEESLDRFAATNNSKGVAKVKTNMGILHAMSGDYDTAERYWEFALNFAESIKDYEWVGVILTNMGGIFELKKDYEKAAFYHRKAIEVTRKAKDKYTETLATLNLAFSQAKLGYFENTARLIEGITPVMKEGFDAYTLACYELIQGIYNTYRGSWEDARKHYEAAIRFANSSGNMELIAHCHEEYGLSLLERDKHEAAKEQLNQSKKILLTIRKKATSGF